MQGLKNFIVTPKNNKQFANTTSVGGVELVTTTNIEEGKDVNREAIIVSLPINYKGNARKGDTCIIHHNIFRPQYDHKGVLIQSSSFIKDNLYTAHPDLVFLIIRDGKAIPVDDYVFIKPFTEEENFLGTVEKEHSGYVKFANENLGVKEGAKIVFRRNCEYEFNINNERLYMMKTKRVLATIN